MMGQHWRVGGLARGMCCVIVGETGFKVRCWQGLFLARSLYGWPPPVSSHGLSSVTGEAWGMLCYTSPVGVGTTP